MTSFTGMPSLSYRIDASDRLVEFGGSWTAFAVAHGAPELDPDAIRGRSIWEFITGTTVIALYQGVMERARRRRSPLRFTFRCDGPDRRRLLSMEVVPDDGGGIVFSVTPVAEADQTQGLVPDALRPSVLERLDMCAWCRRIHLHDDVWTEVEGAIDDLALFGREELPLLSHGVCPACLATLTRLSDSPAG